MMEVLRMLIKKFIELSRVSSVPPLVAPCSVVSRNVTHVYVCLTQFNGFDILL